jgi:hypothetical protein
MTILLTAVGPMDAQAQSASARVSKGDAQKVVTIISAFCHGLSFWGDKAKTQTYCDYAETRFAARGAINELSQKIETPGKTRSVPNIWHIARRV